MPVNSRAKGKRGELEAVKYLKSLGYDDARRTQQYNGDGYSDVIAPETLPILHIEVKFGYPLKTFDLGSKCFREAVEQCVRDSNGLPWIVLWKPKGHRMWRGTTLVNGLLVTATGESLEVMLSEHSGHKPSVD